MQDFALLLRIGLVVFVLSLYPILRFHARQKDREARIEMERMRLQAASGGIGNDRDMNR